MEAADIDDYVRDMRHDVIDDIVDRALPAGSYAESWDAELMQTESLRLLGLDIPAKDWFTEEGIADTEVLDRLTDISDKKMAAKSANVGAQGWGDIQRMIMLQILDQNWKEHLLGLDHLRQGINLRAFGQRDPLNEYKTEAYAMFEIMVDRMRETITQTLSLVEVDINPEGRADLMMPGVGV